MPDVAGNLLDGENSLASLWEESEIFRLLRQPDYHGKCHDCYYQEACGGCRARSLSTTGDIMGEDPWCIYQPEADQQAQQKRVLPGAGSDPVWTPEATERLSKVPFFLRSMVRGGLERYAREKGLTVITPDLMQEMRSFVR